MKVVIVVPTFNERENITRLIPALQRVFLTLRHDAYVLVVDDTSPDGTADAVRQLQTRYSNVHLLLGQKAGLGAAYVRGMEHALKELAADVVFEMDADFSHDPSDVPRLLAEIETGADFVIGSRYVTGGSIPANWGLLRKCISRGGNLVARLVAGIYQVRDCTAGFRAIRASFLKRIPLNRLRVQGYAFQVALLHAAVTGGAKVSEVPVHFVDRASGESKLGMRDILEFVENACWIRLQSSRTFVKFLIVGASGVVVNLGAFTFLLSLGMTKFLASPVAIEISIISNFLLNNYWTFRWRDNRDRTHIKGLKFNAVSFLSLGVSYTTFIVVSFAWPQWPPQIPQLVGIVPATLVNYFFNSYWTFRESKPATQAAHPSENRDSVGDSVER